MHMIRPERTLEIPAIKQRMRGLVTIKRKDMRTGKYDLIREQKPNMVLNDYLENLVGIQTRNDQGNFVNWGSHTNTTEHSYHALRQCSIGSNGTAVSRSGNNILTTLATATAFNTDSEAGPTPQRSADKADPVWTERTWIFPAGTGTGTIREVGTRQAGTVGHIPHVARQVISPEIEKSEYHQLEVTWRAEWSRGINHPWNGTIVNGGKDGTTDIGWAFEINDSQLMTWCRRDNEQIISRVQISSFNRYMGNPIAHWNGSSMLTANRPQIIVGTDGSAGNLATDGQYTIQGTQLMSGAVPVWEEPTRTITANGAELAVRIGFDTGDINGNVGEIVLCSEESTRTTWAAGGLGRLRLDPPLPKDDSHRLFFDLKFQFDAS